MGEDDDEEEKRCPAGSFADSKVVEFCPEHFLSGKKKKTTMWSVLYYVPEDTTKKSLSSVWRALADVAPAHNKNAAIGAVDCSKHKSFCENMGMKAKSLPAALRYAPSGNDRSCNLSCCDVHRRICARRFGSLG